MSETMTPVAPVEFVDAMNHFASGVAVVTSFDGDRTVGATVAAIAPIASDPPTVMVSMSSESSTAAAILRTGSFAINVLDEDGAAIAGRFASRVPDKFADVEIRQDALGNPLLPNRVGALSCLVTDSVATGSHWEIRGSAVDVDTTGGNPLAYYRGSFAHLTTDADRSLLDAVRAHVLSMRSDEVHALDPDDLARGLAVPRGAVLRALSSLKSEALVDRVDGAYYVASVSDELVDAAYEAKLAMEIGVAVQVIDCITDADVHALRERIKRIRYAAPGGESENLDDLVLALNDFGEYFVGLAGSEPLVRAYRSLGLPGIDRRTITSAIFASIPPTGGVDEVVDGLESRDLPSVLEALRSDRRTPAFVRDAARRKG